MAILSQFLKILKKLIKPKKKRKRKVKKRKTRQKSPPKKKSPAKKSKAKKKKKPAKKAAPKKKAKTPQKKKKAVKKQKVKRPVKRKQKPDKKVQKNKQKITNSPQFGEITHYFNKIQVAVIQLTKGKISVGQKINIKGSSTDFVQPVRSLQIESVDVKVAKKGQLAGLKVKKKVHVGDKVYLAG